MCPYNWVLDRVAYRTKGQWICGKKTKDNQTQILGYFCLNVNESKSASWVGSLVGACRRKKKKKPQSLHMLDSQALRTLLNKNQGSPPPWGSNILAGPTTSIFMDSLFLFFWLQTLNNSHFTHHTILQTSGSHICTSVQR